MPITSVIVTIIVIAALGVQMLCVYKMMSRGWGSGHISGLGGSMCGGLMALASLNFSNPDYTAAAAILGVGITIYFAMESRATYDAALNAGARRLHLP